jgi:hypothetical protein
MKLTKTGELRMTKQLTKPSTALIAIDDVIDNLPFIVRRDHRIVAGFAKKTHALEWAETRSWNDESRFAVHTANEVINAYTDGEPENDDE